MTVTNTASPWAYAGNGVTTTFAYTNLIVAASDLKVYLDGVPQTAGYTVSNIGVATGGNVTFATAPAKGVAVMIVRDVSATQEISYVAKAALAGGVPSVPVSAFAETLLDDANAAAARETLDLGGYINAKHFGAVGDGCTDDTAALRAAYLAACAVKGTLFIPNGVYITSGLQLGGGFGEYCTIQGESFDTVGGGYGSILRLKAGSNANLISFGALNPGGLNRIMNLTLDGTKSLQTNWSAGVYAPDISSPPPGSYYWGVWLKNVRIVNTWATGVYIGRYRGGSYLDNVWMYQCGTDQYHYGVHINNYDVVMNFVNVGNSSGTGITIANASQIHGFSVNCYYNAGSGIYIDGTVTDLALYACSMDRNQKSGIEIYSNINTTYRGSRRLLSGFRFLTNGQAAHNTYSDIACHDANSDVTLIGASFQGSETAIKVAHNITLAAGSRFKLFGCKFDTVKPGYARAAISPPRLAEGDAPEVGVSPAGLPSFTVGGLPSAAVAGQLIYVSNGAANKRLAISDGTNWRFPDGNVVT